MSNNRNKTGSGLSGVMWILLIIVVVSGFIFVAINGKNDRKGNFTAAQGRDHIQIGNVHDEYITNPPTSGDHYANASAWGIFLKPLADEQAVHNLEHGGIWISYKDLDEESLAKLVAFAKEHSQSVILSPRKENDSNIALASWERLDQMETLDMERVENFYKGNKNKSPEPLAGI